MSWQQSSPPPSFPQPYATQWSSSNPAQNRAGDSARRQDDLPPNHPPGHNTSGSSSQVYASSQQFAATPSRRSTDPTAPTHEYSSSFSRQPAPPPSGSTSHYQPFPTSHASFSSSPPPPMTHRAVTMPIPIRQNVASRPYNTTSPHFPSRSMSGGPQASSQGWSYLDVVDRENESVDSSDFSGEQSPVGMGDSQKRSPPSFPFAGRKSHGRRPGKGSSSASGSPVPDQLPCRLCKKLNPRHIVEYYGGFCCENHRTQWIAVYQGY